MSELNWIEKDLGPIDAYAYAVENGYFSGTREQWYAMISSSTEHASDAEAYAKGTRAGEAVSSDDPAYHNNASYWNSQAEAQAGSAEDSAEDAEAYAKGTRGGEAVASDDPAYHNSAKYWEEQAEIQKTAAQTAASTASAAYNVNLLAPNYSSESTYNVGDHVIYSGGYYECISAITTAEAWTSAHWKQLTVGGEAGDLKSACVKGSGKYFNIDNPASAPYDDMGTIPMHEIISYSDACFPDGTPDEITSGVITVISFSRSDDGEYKPLTVQLIAHRTSDSRVSAELYSRMSWGTSNPTWTPWEKIARSSVIEPWLNSLQAKVDELSNKNQFEIKTSNSIAMREATTTSNTDGTFKINGAVTSSKLNRSYTIYDNIGDSSSAKDIQLKAGVKYIFGYQYISGTLNREDVLLMEVRNSPSLDTVLASVNVCEADARCEFSVNNDTTVRIRVFVEKNTTYTNYTVKPFLIRDDVSNIVITPSMFSKIAVIGDSFASGISGEEGTAYEYSWLQMMAREYGCTGENFSSGGLTTRTWLTNSNGLAKLQNSDPCNLYFIALGINDSNPDSRNVPVGVITDMDEETPPDTFYGNNKKIRNAILAKNEHAVICYITPMRVGARYIPYQDAVVAMANKYGCLLIDWRDVAYNNGTWWNENLVNSHPRVAMYNAMMHSISELLNKSIQENMTYMRPYPNIENT